MSAASDLFERLVDFKSSAKPEEDFLEYCRNVLSSVEKQHFDYKTKGNASKARLDDVDKKNLAKAVSGFANSSGGVLIWGIKDETLEAKPISEIENFARNLASLASQTTDPVVQEIKVNFLPSDLDTEAGYVFIFIQESQTTPHRVILKDSDVKNHYFFRSSDSFHVASHFQLEDMFGRRPKPILKLRIINTLGFQSNIFYIKIKNVGKGSARSPYVELEVPNNFSEFRGYSESVQRITGFYKIPHQIGNSSEFGQKLKFYSKSDVIIHPNMEYELTAFESVSDNIDALFKLKYLMIAEGTREFMGESQELANSVYSEIEL